MNKWDCYKYLIILYQQQQNTNVMINIIIDPHYNKINVSFVVDHFYKLFTGDQR